MASATTTSEPDSFLSMRTSCDRCRKQKLKCFVGTQPRNTSEASISCQRCARAVVPCVFGRRSRSTRTTAGGVGAASDPKPSEIREMEQSSAVVPATPNAQNPYAARPADTRITAPSPTPQTASSLEHFVFEETDWNQLLPGANVEDNLEYVFLENSAIGAPPLFNPHDISHSFHMDEDNPLSMPDVASPMPQITSTDFEIPGPEPLNLGETSVKSQREQATSQALRLASTLHETLEALNTRPWLSSLGTKIHFLENYPIGRILHSTKELASLASSLQTVESGNVSERSGPSESNLDGAIPDTMCMTPTSSMSRSKSTPPHDKALSLLLLSCFISLTRIYTVVLRHFQGHLNRTLARGPEIQHEINADMAPLHLSELPSENSPLTRMHTALRMLVDSLRLAEEALCFPTKTRFALEQGQQDTVGEKSNGLIPQDLVTASNFQEDYAALERMVIETKGLLREKMGL